MSAYVLQSEQDGERPVGATRRVLDQPGKSTSMASDFSWSQLLGALVMINAQLFRALVNAGPNNAQIIGADNGRPRADIDHIITQLFS